MGPHVFMGGSNLMQMYGKFTRFPLNGALCGLVIQ